VREEKPNFDSELVSFGSLRKLSGTDNIDASWNLFKCSFAVNGIVVSWGNENVI